MSKFYYKEIPESLVNPQAVQWASIALDHCKKDLRLSDEVYIQWCLPATKEEYDRQENDQVGSALQEFWGMMITSKLSDKKNRILLRADIPTDKIVHTLAHECRHIADRDHHGEYSITSHLSADEHSSHPSEIRANTYANKIVPEIREKIALWNELENLTESLKTLRRMINHD